MDAEVAPEVVTPVFCSEPEDGTVGSTEARAAPLSGFGNDSQAKALDGSATTGTTPAPISTAESGTAAAFSSQDSTPASPAGSPAPVRLPAPLPPPAPAAPVGPAGPTGSSAAASSSASCHGAGSSDHSDGIDAVLEAQVAVSLAQAALRLSSGFAGSVVGGADDPGASPT